MKYSLASLNKALDVILPNCWSWRVHRVDLMRMAAEQVFTYPDNFVGVKSTIAIDVLRAAYRDLKEGGCFEFGELEVLNDDVVSEVLLPGEFKISEDALKRYGSPLLEKLNNYPLPKATK